MVLSIFLTQKKYLQSPIDYYLLIFVNLIKNYQ